jgi:4-hydroxybenzoate polyprenyltransferase
MLSLSFNAGERTAGPLPSSLLDLWAVGGRRSAGYVFNEVFDLKPTSDILAR